MILRPASGFGLASSSASIAATISSGSAMRPSPASPLSAISPRFGPTKRTPSFSSVARLRRVAGCDHIFGFMAGAISTGLSVASSTAEARSLARPLASLAIRSAVAGATTIEVGLAGQPDMADILLVLAVEQIGEDMVGGQRADRQRRDELLRRLGHHGAHRGAALAQPADQVERLVGGDAAADDQQDALAGKGHFDRERSAEQLRRARESSSTSIGEAICESSAVSASRCPVPLVSPAATSLMIVRASCSIDTPRSAARSRNLRFTLSSRFRIVSVAIAFSPLPEDRLERQCMQ